MSPIRVITTLSSSLPTNSPKGGLSPSRIPTTLPPKKSLSPSRTIYIETRRTPSPKPVRSTGPSPTSGVVVNQPVQGQTRMSQGQILSHLPLLAQTLQQRDQSHEIFQQYKTQRPDVRPTYQGPGPKPTVSVVTVGRVSPGPPRHELPRPAHQGSPTPPHVSTIRRTPSPAHMPIGSDFTAKVIVEHTSRPQAVNLVKPHSHEQKVTDYCNNKQ